MNKQKPLTHGAAAKRSGRGVDFGLIMEEKLEMAGARSGSTLQRSIPAWMSHLLGFCLLMFAVAVSEPSASGQGNFLQITNLKVASEGWRLGWETGTNAAFSVQYQETLRDGIWRIPDSALPVATNYWIEPVGTNASRFYRVTGVPQADRGKVLGAPTFVRTVSLLELGFYYSQGLLPVAPRYSVRLYKVVYETITPIGGKTRASGALILPESTGRPLPLISYQHGTITQTNKAPSAMETTGEAFVGVAMATAGYAVVEADYLGLGESPGLHPYHHARSEASACVDLLRAARTICSTNGFPLTNRLFLCGYSQGGHATLALLREIETHHAAEFPVTACAPMAGAYDLPGVTTGDFLSGRIFPNPYYFLYLLAAFQDVYHFAPTLQDLLAPPYNTTLPPLLHGNTTGGIINAALPQDPTLILKPEYLVAFRSDPRHPLRLALRDNGLCDWTPSTPLRLYHCSGDQDVIVANSKVAAAGFQARGATNVVWLDPLPGANHGGCAQPSLLAAKIWFDSFN